jgi:AraC-like DNA-binding protein
MKILPFKIAKPVNESFWIQQESLPHLYDILHQHDEMQITLIKESTGTVIAGNQICEFQPGDIFVFGIKLPHAFRNDPAYYNLENDLKAKAISVYFEWNVFGVTFWELPEARMLSDYALLAERGLFYSGDSHKHIAENIKKLTEVNNIDRLILLLTVLKQLAESELKVILSTEGTYNKLNENDEKRLGAIYRFTMNEFHRVINLEEVAGVANMTVNSFCRYFKTHTRKSYLNFLTEYRIGQACKLLQQEEFSIADISYRVGFGNLSNFNRKFKEISNCTPKEYRKKQNE